MSQNIAESLDPSPFIILKGPYYTDFPLPLLITGPNFPGKLNILNVLNKLSATAIGQNIKTAGAL